MKTTKNILGPQKIAQHEIETQICATFSSLLYTLNTCSFLKNTFINKNYRIFKQHIKILPSDVKLLFFYFLKYFTANEKKITFDDHTTKSTQTDHLKKE